MPAHPLPPPPVWSPDCSVGVPELDAQHRHLFELAARLQDAVQTGQVARLLGEAFESLAAYSEGHFQAEETLMSRSGYAGLPAHREEHERFRRKVRYFRRSLQLGKPGVGAEVVEFLHGWLARHIGEADQGYAAHLRGFPDAPPADG